MRERSKKRLGEILIDAGNITKENLEEALLKQKKDGGLVGQILISLGHIKEETLVAALGQQLRLPYLPIQNYSFNRDALGLMEEEFWRRHLMLAFDRDEHRIFLTMADPLSEDAIEELEKKTGLKSQIFISTNTEILSMLDLAFAATSAKKELKKAG